MAFAAHLPATKPGDYAVPPPRVTDAIGGALRRAYREDNVPADLLALLGRLGNA